MEKTLFRKFVKTANLKTMTSFKNLPRRPGRSWKTMHISSTNLARPLYPETFLRRFLFFFKDSFKTHSNVSKKLREVNEIPVQNFFQTFLKISFFEKLTEFLSEISIQNFLKITFPFRDNSLSINYHARSIVKIKT